MALNFDGIYELRFFYTVTTSEGAEDHRLSLDVTLDGAVNPGDTFDNVALMLPTGVSVQADTYIDTTFMPLLVECFNANTEFSRVELWEIPEGTYNGTFLSVHELGDVGVNPAATVTAQQTTFTFRTRGGGNGRLQLMEAVFTGNSRQSPPFASAAANNISNHMVSTSCPFVGRDNTRFIARIAQSDGQNEKLWRKRFRE